MIQPAAAQDRHAADAGLVVPEAKASCAHSTSESPPCAAGRAGGADHEAADLGTSLLVLAAGFVGHLFAGLPWKLVVPPRAAGGGGYRADRRFRAPAVRQRGALAGAATTSSSVSARCWTPRATRARVSTSSGDDCHRCGRVFGRAWRAQTHLEFIPERTTGFRFCRFFRGIRPSATLFLIIVLSVPGLARAGHCHGAGTLFAAA